MSLYVGIDGVKNKVEIDDAELAFTTEYKRESWKIADVIGAEGHDAENNANSRLTLHIIQEVENHELIDKTIQVEAEKSVCVDFSNKLAEKIGKVSCRPKRLLILINPMGGSKTAEQQYKDTVEPLLRLANIETDVHLSVRPQHFIDILDKYDYSKISGALVFGGDGTVNECVACFYKRAQENAGHDINNPNSKATPFPFPIGQIPTGTANGLVQIACDTTEVVTATLHVIRGKIYKVNLFGVYSGGQLLSYFSVLFMFGAWAELFNFIDRHRWLKTLRYLILPFYHFLLRRQPCYEVEIDLLRHQSTEGSTINEKYLECQQNDTEKIDTQRLDLTNLVMHNNDGYTEQFYYLDDPEDRVFERTVVSLYRPCWRTQLLSQLLQFILRRDPDTLIKDYIRNERVRGIKVKIQSHHNEPILVNIDGEAMELPNPEFEVRLMGRILPVYSSRFS